MQGIDVNKPDLRGESIYLIRIDLWKCRRADGMDLAQAHYFFAHRFTSKNSGRTVFYLNAYILHILTFSQLYRRVWGELRTTRTTYQIDQSNGVTSFSEKVWTKPVRLNSIQLACYASHASNGTAQKITLPTTAWNKKSWRQGTFSFSNVDCGVRHPKQDYLFTLLTQTDPNSSFDSVAVARQLIFLISSIKDWLQRTSLGTMKRTISFPGIPGSESFRATGAESCFPLSSLSLFATCT